MRALAVAMKLSNIPRSWLVHSDMLLNLEEGDDLEVECQCIAFFSDCFYSTNCRLRLLR